MDTIAAFLQHISLYEMTAQNPLTSHLEESLEKMARYYKLYLNYQVAHCTINRKTMKAHGFLFVGRSWLACINERGL
jgi:hypothetical protein